MNKWMEEQYEALGISREVYEFGEKIEDSLKERFAAIVTDGLRAEYLESVGYDVQILEFIDMEHTPKNLLIRAIKNDKKEQSRVKKKSLSAKHSYM